MSQGYATGGADPYVATPGQESNMADTAKHEAGEVKDAAAGAAKDVAATAKHEAGGVARETKNQARALLEESRHELRDQASKQQQRLAAGLTSVGDDLGSMAAGSQSSGVASDIVQQVSDRVGAAGAWLADRDPAAVFSEVKSFARRRPGVFIAAGVLAGVVVGRLTRALASNAGNASKSAGDGAGYRSPALPASTGYETAPAADAPIYSQSAARFDGGGMETADERSDTL